jgi:membrane-bound ClpP family serine protease
LLDSRVIIKYTLLHLAELAVVILLVIVAGHYIAVPRWLAFTIPAVWLAKDLALFPMVWRSYASGDNDPVRQLIGLEAIVADDLDPVGYVRVRGELWRAEVRNSQSLAKRGDRMKVVDVRRMTLIVERDDTH